MDTTGRQPHHWYADYFRGVAAELESHDGFRLLTDRRPIPFELVRPLLAVAVSHDETLGLVAVDLIDRASMVSGVIDEALYNLPAGADPSVATTIVLDADEPVLIRF